MVVVDLPMIALSILRWQNVSVNVITIKNSFQSGDKVIADIKRLKIICMLINPWSHSTTIEFVHSAILQLIMMEVYVINV
jgi:hypothetical protein